MALSYYLYVRHKTNYFVARDLRLMASAVVQVDDAFMRNAGYVRNFAAITREGLRTRRAASSSGLVKQIDLYFPEFETLVHDADIPESDKPAEGVEEIRKRLSRAPNVEEFETSIVPRETTTWVDITYRALGKTDSKEEAPKAEALQQAMAEEAKAPLRTSFGQIELKRLLDPVFSSPTLDAFDEVLLANSDGTVVAQSHRWLETSRQSSMVTAIGNPSGVTPSTASSPVKITSLSSVLERSGWRETKPLDISSVTGATRQIDVSIAGSDYVLFVQPCHFAAKFAKPKQPATENKNAPTAGAEAKKETKEGAPQWLLCALIAKPRFVYDSLAISLTQLSVVTGCLLLLICCWPFVRLTFIGERQPLTLADLILLGVCCLIGGAILTIGFADAVLYRRLEAVADVQLKEFSALLERSFETETVDARNALELVMQIKRKPEGGTFGDLKFNDADENLKAIQQKYPFFSSVSFIGSNGMQLLKFSKDGSAPAVSVADRNYFRDVQSGRMLLTREREPKPFVIESLVSKTTGKPEVVLSIPADADYPVVALTLEKSALLRPILPAAFKFAVVDDAGNVLFHSNPQLNNRENFFEETEGDRQLRAAVAARHDLVVDNVRYGGEDYVAFTHPMRVGWTLITLRSKGLMRTMNTEAIVLTLLALIFYASLCVVLTLVAAMCVPSYRAPWLWPDVTRPDRYRRVTFLYLLLLISSVAQIIALRPSALFLIGFLAPMHVAATTYVRLAIKRNTPAFYTIAAAWTALTVSWCARIVLSPIGEGVYLGDSPLGLRIFMLIPIVIATLLVLKKLTTPLRALAFAFGIASLVAQSVALTPWGCAISFSIAAFFAVVTIATASRSPRPTDGTRLKWGVLLLAWCFILVFVPLRSEYVDETSGALLRIVTVLLLVPLVLVWEPHEKKEKPDKRRAPFEGWRYIVAGVGLAILTIVIPTIAFFRVAYALEVESFIKYGQLLFAAGLEQELEADVSSSVASCWKPTKEGDRADFFKSSWWITGTKGEKETFANWIADSWTSRGGNDVGEFLESMLPQYSRDSVAMRELHHDQTSDRRWEWRRRGSYLALRWPLHLSAEATRKLAENGETPKWITVFTRVPQPFAAWSRVDIFPFPLTKPRVDLMSMSAVNVESGSDTALRAFVRRFTYLVVAVSFLGLIVWVVYFISIKVFLLDLQRPLWLPRRDSEFRRPLLKPTVGSHVFLISRTREMPETLAGDFHHVQLETAYNEIGATQLILQIDELPHGKQVVITGIEAEPSDEGFTLFKITVLEEVLALSDRMLLIISKLSPAALIATVSDDAVKERWRDALSSFVCLYEDQINAEEPVVPEIVEPDEEKVIVVTPPPPPPPPPRTIMQWLRDFIALDLQLIPTSVEKLKTLLACEIDGRPALQRIGTELESEIDNHRFIGDRVQLLDEIRERADAYYNALWSTCSLDEHLLLFHLARFGFLNGRNRRMVRRLLARGLVVRTPHLHLFNDSFRAYVIANSSRQEVASLERADAAESAWGRIRGPVLTVVVIGAAVFFSTQKDLMNTTSAMVTGIAAGLPALAKLVGTLTDRRGDQAAMQ